MKKTFVTRPFLPPLEEYIPYLKKIWDSKHLTNNGPFHQEFEARLSDYLGVKYISLFTNGTLALITALKALNISGKVITTPYSFVATSHALWWNNIEPVFVDIEQNGFNIAPKQIEKAITSDTTAILPVHVYGLPCNVDQIDRIAKSNGLKVIYDAAHAFNVKRDQNSILNYGDLSVLSFHATKVFNTMEGGAVICHTKEMKHHIDNLKNFGFRGETVVEEPGINAKMNEMQAALGLLQLEYIDDIIEKRRIKCNKYFELLSQVPGINLIDFEENMNHNFAYFPILIDEELFGKSRDSLYTLLTNRGYYGRRYFYPLISNLKPYSGLPSSNPINLPVANEISNNVLCLPIFPDLEINDIEQICNIINNV